MPDPTTFAYFGLAGYQLLWLLTLLSFAVFGSRVLQHVRILAQARPDPRWDYVGRRSWRVVTEVLFQRRLLDEPLIGIAHLLIFWSFVLFAATFFWGLLRGLIPTLPISYPDDVGWIAPAMELFAVLGLTALGVAAVRRYVFTPVALERSRDATTILILIAVVLGSFLALSGFRVLTHPSEQAWRPVGGLLSNGLLAAGAAREAGTNCIWACGGFIWPRYLAFWRTCRSPSTCTCWPRRLPSSFPRLMPVGCHHTPRVRRACLNSPGANSSAGSRALSAGDAIAYALPSRAVWHLIPRS